MTDPRSRDRQEVEALLTDAYLDSLLAARDRRAFDVPADPGLDPALRTAARRLEAELGRVHPSFRFEERLAAQLRRRALELSAGRPFGAAPREAAGALVVQIPAPPRPVAATVRRAPRSSPLAVARRIGRQPAAMLRFDGPVPRPVLIGGALTSAALSLAGAYIAWRRSRPSH